MSSNIKKNYIYNATYSVLLVISPLITAPYLARVLQADGVGIASFAASIVQYFTIAADFGTVGFGRRETAYVRDDIEERSLIFWEVMALRCINAVIAAAVYIAVVMSCVKEYRIIFLIHIIDIFSLALEVSWFLSGLEEFEKIIFRNFLVRIADIAFIFLFVKSHSDLAVSVFGYAIFSALGTLLMWGYIPALVSRPKLKTLRPFRHIKASLSMFIPSVAIQVYTVLDKSMLGWFTEGGFENGYYEQSLKISRLLLALITSLSGVMIPRIGYLFGKNDHEQINSYMYRSYNFVWFISVALCFGVMGVADNFVPWFFGPGYDKVSGLLRYSSLLIIILSFSTTTGVQYLIPTKRQTLFTYSVVIGALVNFPLNLILIPMYQSYGAMTASIVAEFFVSASELYMVRHELSISKIMMLSVKYLIAGAVMLAVLLLMSSRLEPSMASTFKMFLAGAATYMMSLVVLRDKFFMTYSARSAGFILRKLGFQREEAQ